MTNETLVTRPQSRRSAGPLLAAALVGLGGLGYGAWREQVRRNDQLTQRVEALQRHVTQLEEKGAARSSEHVSWREVARGAGTRTLAPGTIPASAAAGDTSTEVSPRAVRPDAPEAEEMAAHIGSEFAAQDDDVGWSRPAEKRLLLALSEQLPEGSLLQDVRCRASLCEMRSSHVDRERYQSFVDAATAARTGELWNGAFATFITEESKGGLQALTYLAKEGQELPMPAAED
jgi:ATP-dependent exoDNAse (exonuclease V) beta subunit